MCQFFTSKKGNQFAFCILIAQTVGCHILHSLAVIRKSVSYAELYVFIILDFSFFVNRYFVKIKAVWLRALGQNLQLYPLPRL